MPAESNNLAVSKAEEKRFERGFKAWCDNSASSIRKRLNLSDSDPLPPELLAANMGVTIMTLENVPGIEAETFRHLSSAEGDEWSAVTVHVPGKQIIIVNPRHSNARQASNIMHELAHLIRGHKPSQVYAYEAYALRDFDQLQENEANWLAGCLLLPRPALLSAGYRNESADEVIEKFGVSRSLYNYRFNISGVRRQLSSRR